MLFNSINYFVFLPIVFSIFWLVKEKYRKIILLLASFFFYMCWNVKYISLLILIILIAYFSAILIEKFKRRKTILVISILCCLSVLFTFKYLNFFLSNIAFLLRLFKLKTSIILVDLLLPVGISFYIFQAVGYIVDVYKGDIKAEKNIISFAAFISFFPQLVAGPIEKSENLLPQINNKHVFDYQQSIFGIKLIILGYFKKLVIADSISPYVDKVYSNSYSFVGFDLALVVLFFSIQIFCDFSGYSDIAIGTAKLFNINLMQNFRCPYFSTSIKDFWNNWHVSLSEWFKKYIYFPLGGSKCTKMKNYFNLIITFLVSGLWHGANWTFIIWGGIHGIAQIIERRFSVNKSSKNPFIKILRSLIVFCFCSIAWVFFRANNLKQAIYIICNVFNGISNMNNYLHTRLSISIGQIIFYLILFLIMFLFDYALNSGIIKNNKKIDNYLYLFLGVLIILFSPKGVAADFVYFQF